MFAYFIFFVCCVHLSFAQYPLPENTTCDTFCPSIAIDPKDVQGIWFLARDIAGFYSEGATCVYLNITGENFEQVQTIDGKKYVSTGSLFYNATGVYLTLHNAKTDITFRFLLKIVSLTADSMAFASCLDCGFFSKNGSGVYASVYTRLQFPSCGSVVKNVEATGACGIPPSAFTIVDHSNCHQECPASSFSSVAPASVVSSWSSMRTASSVAPSA